MRKPHLSACEAETGDSLEAVGGCGVAVDGGGRGGAEVEAGGVCGATGGGGWRCEGPVGCVRVRKGEGRGCWWRRRARKYG